MQDGYMNNFTTIKQKVILIGQLDRNIHFTSCLTRERFFSDIFSDQNAKESISAS